MFLIYYRKTPFLVSGTAIKFYFFTWLLYLILFAFLKLNFLRNLISGTNIEKVLLKHRSLKFKMIFSFFTICTGTKSKKKGQKILQKNFKIANSIRYKKQVKKLNLIAEPETKNGVFRYL